MYGAYRVIGGCPLGFIEVRFAVFRVMIFNLCIMGLSWYGIVNLARVMTTYRTYLQDNYLLQMQIVHIYQKNTWSTKYQSAPVPLHVVFQSK